MQRPGRAKSETRAAGGAAANLLSRLNLEDRVDARHEPTLFSYEHGASQR
jgi:hypothetical protein